MLPNAQRAVWDFKGENCSAISSISGVRNSSLGSSGNWFPNGLSLAYSIYFKRSLPVTTIGKQAGIINFPSVIHNHKAAGWDVPTSLFKYDGDEIRSRLRKRRKVKALAVCLICTRYERTKGWQEYGEAFSMSGFWR